MSAKSTCVITIVSNKWQVLGFLYAANRFRPSKIIVLKLKNFSIDKSIRNKIETPVEEHLIHGLHNLNSLSFSASYRLIFSRSKSYWTELLSSIDCDRSVLITDNELRPVEMLIRYTYSKVDKIVIYEHGIELEIGSWMSTLIGITRKARSGVTTLFYALKYKHRIYSNFYKIKQEKFYRKSKIDCSGDIFLYANLQRNTLISARKKAAVFFSSGAFRYDDTNFKRTTLIAFNNILEHVKSANLHLVIKLKPGEDKEEYLPLLRMGYTYEFAEELMDFSDIALKYRPSVVYAANSSTVIGEAVAFDLRAVMYEVSGSSRLLRNSKGGEWFNAGIELLRLDGSLLTTRFKVSTPRKVLEEVYQLETSREHLNTYD